MKWVIFFFLFSTQAFAVNELRLELGEASSAYNKVKIPGDGGTRFNAASALDPTFFYRLSYLHYFKSRHGLRLLYAPLKFTGDKTYSQDINFQGVNFSGGQKTNVEYQFNSYRATYFYSMIDKPNFRLDLGATAKIRDARIKLSQSGASKTKVNTGIVPLLYLYAEYLTDFDIKLIFDFDGLIAPQGRALDMAFMLGYEFPKNWEINTGIRMLEGGVDNDKVYNFSQINYFFMGARYSF